MKDGASAMDGVGGSANAKESAARRNVSLGGYGGRSQLFCANIHGNNRQRWRVLVWRRLRAPGPMTGLTLRDGEASSFNVSGLRVGRRRGSLGASVVSVVRLADDDVIPTSSRGPATGQTRHDDGQYHCASSVSQGEGGARNHHQHSRMGDVKSLPEIVARSNQNTRRIQAPARQGEFFPVA